MIKKLNYLSGSVGRLGLPQSVRNIAIMVNNCISTINQLIDKVEKLEAKNKELRQQLDNVRRTENDNKFFSQ